jgi:hypothetical protein
MAGMLQMRRSRGAFSGFLLVLLGLWGALIPMVGPYFNYAYTPDVSWHYDTARLWLEILPGAAVFLGGLLLIIATGRHVALFGALLAAASGAWFVLGVTLSPLWNHNVPMGGVPAGSRVFTRIMEQIGFFSALGVLIVFIAGAALGRILSVPSGIRPVQEVAPATTVPAATVPDTTVPDTTVPATTVPADRVPADQVPADDRVPAETSAVETLPRRTVATEKVPAEETQTIPAEDTQSIS